MGSDDLFKLTTEPKDVDSWEIAMTPVQYLANFGSSLAVVKLSSHTTPKPPMEDEVFSNFFLLAESNHQLWMDQDFKAPFFQELKRWRIVQPAASAWVSSYGSPHIPTNLFVYCLQVIKCPTLLMRQYGQKCPLMPQFLPQEPAPHHSLSYLNNWDIGITYLSDMVFLFAPTKGPGPEVESFPMVIPGSLDFGSLRWHLPHEGHTYQVKMYPR